jgi:hypothetical protein
MGNAKHELRLLKTPSLGAFKTRFFKGFQEMKNGKWEEKGKVGFDRFVAIK